MIIAEATTGQVIKFIPRSLDATGSFAIMGEQTNTTTTISGLSFTEDRHYLYATVDLSALENEQQYCLVVSGVSREIYRTILFLTDQTVSSYSINDGQYLEPSSNIEYLVG